jgi:hypothetical protein
MVVHNQIEDLRGTDDGLGRIRQAHPPHLVWKQSAEGECDETAHRARVKELGGKGVKQHRIFVYTASETELDVAKGQKSDRGSVQPGVRALAALKIERELLVSKLLDYFGVGKPCFD